MWITTEGQVSSISLDSPSKYATALNGPCIVDLNL